MRGCTSEGCGEELFIYGAVFWPKPAKIASIQEMGLVWVIPIYQAVLVHLERQKSANLTLFMLKFSRFPTEINLAVTQSGGLF